MPGAIGVNAVKDGNNTLIVGGVRMFDVSGTGVGPWVPVAQLYDPVSGALGVIKPASTAPLATDPALVVSISPNSVNANGSGLAANSAPTTNAPTSFRIAVTPTVTASAYTAGNVLGGIMTFANI